MREWSRALVPAVLVAQALMAGLGGATERPPAMADLSRFPDRIGLWSKTSDQKVDPAVEAQLGADQLISRTYVSVPAGTVADLFIAWFQSQRGGKTQPHSPKVCLPGSGWTPVESGEMQIETAAGAIPVNRYVISSNFGQRAVVLYWYQTPRRVLAGEWESKFWLIPDAIRDHRTDTSLVRVIVWTTKGAEAAATATAADFARGLHPVLRETLPR